MPPSPYTHTPRSPGPARGTPPPLGREDFGGPPTLPRHWGRKEAEGGRVRGRSGRPARAQLVSRAPSRRRGGRRELRGEPGLGIPPRPGSAVRLPFAAAASPSSSSAAAAASPTRAAVSTVAAAACTTTAAASAAAAAAASDSTRQGGHLSPPSLPAQPLRSAAAANSLRPLPPLLVAEGEGRRGGRAGSPRGGCCRSKTLAGWRRRSPLLGSGSLGLPTSLCPHPPRARLPSPHPPSSR